MKEAGVNDRRLRLPRLYPILDADLLTSRVPPEKLTAAVCDFAEQLVAGGVTLLQYRANQLPTRQVLSHARELRRVLGGATTLFINGRADLGLAAGFDGVEVGEHELSPESVRRLTGEKLWVGYSIHDVARAERGDEAPVDYVAIGPIFSEGREENLGQTVGLKGLAAVRAKTHKPLVAFGGITRENAKAALEAGADAVAVMGDLLEDPKRAAEEFLAVLV